MMGRWRWWPAPAEGGELPSRWADFGRAAFVARAGCREAPFLEVAVDDMPLRGFDLLPRLMPDPIVTSIRKSEIRVPGLRLRSVVAVMAWMAAPKGLVEACATRRRAPEKAFMVLCGHESARRGAVNCLSTVLGKNPTLLKHCLSRP